MAGLIKKKLVSPGQLLYRQRRLGPKTPRCCDNQGSGNSFRVAAGMLGDDIHCGVGELADSHVQ